MNKKREKTEFKTWLLSCRSKEQPGEFFFFFLKHSLITWNFHGVSFSCSSLKKERELKREMLFYSPLSCCSLGLCLLIHAAVRLNWESQTPLVCKHEGAKWTSFLFLSFFSLSALSWPSLPLHPFL